MGLYMKEHLYCYCATKPIDPLNIFSLKCALVPKVYMLIGLTRQARGYGRIAHFYPLPTWNQP